MVDFRRPGHIYTYVIQPLHYGVHNVHTLVHKQCQFITFKGLTTIFKASTNVSFDTDLLIFVTAIPLSVIMHIMQILFCL